MRESLIGIAILLAVLAGCQAWQRVQDDLSREDSTIAAAAREGAERFAEAKTEEE